MTAICPKTHNWKKYSFVLLGHPRKALSLPHHTSPFLPPDKGCEAVLCHSIPMPCHIGHPVPTYIILLNGQYSKHKCNDLYFVCVITTLSSIYTWWCQSPHDNDKQGIMNKSNHHMHHKISPKYDKSQKLQHNGKCITNHLIPQYPP